LSRNENFFNHFNAKNINNLLNKMLAESREGIFNYTTLFFKNLYNHITNADALDGSSAEVRNLQDILAVRAHGDPAGIESFYNEISQELAKHLQDNNLELTNKLVGFNALSDEEIKKLRELRQIFSTASEQLNKVADEKREVDKNSRDQLMARIAVSILLPGLLEATEILFNVLGNFGESFSEGVAQTMKDAKVFGPFAEMLDKLGFDEMGKFFAQEIPIFSDINQLVHETLSSDYAQPFAEIGHSLIGSELSSLAFKALIAGYTIAKEVDLYSESLKIDKKVDEVFTESMKNISKITEKNVERLAELWSDLEMNAIFKTINIESFLKAKDNNLLDTSYLDKEEYSVAGASFMPEKKSLKDLTLDEIKKLDKSQLEKLAEQAKQWLDNAKSIDPPQDEITQIITENTAGKNRALDRIINKINLHKSDDEKIKRDDFHTDPDIAKDGLKTIHKDHLKIMIYEEILNQPKGKEWSGQDSASFDDKPPSTETTLRRSLDGQAPASPLVPSLAVERPPVAVLPPVSVHLPDSSLAELGPLTDTPLRLGASPSSTPLRRGSEESFASSSLVYPTSDSMAEPPVPASPTTDLIGSSPPTDQKIRGILRNREPRPATSLRRVAFADKPDARFP
jgi:hypothetical protein